MPARPRYIFAIIISIVLLWPTQGTGHEGHTDQKLLLEDAIEDLKAADAARKYNTEELLDLSRQDNIPESEILEYTQFVTELKRAVLEGCRSVEALGGDGNDHGVDCQQIEEDPGNQQSAGVGDIERQATRQEKADALKEKLRELESDLDDMLLKGQAKLEKQDDTGGAGGGLAGEIGEQIQKAEEQLQKAEGQTQQTGSPQEGTGSAAEGSGAGAGPVSTVKSETGAGPGIEKQGRPPAGRPDDIGDGSDDDVVARQLREAAEAETDPALKEQLWDEYRKYKKSRR